MADSKTTLLPPGDVVVNLPPNTSQTSSFYNKNKKQEEQCSDYLSCERICADTCTAILGFFAGLFCCCLGYICGLGCLNDKPKFYVYMIMVTIGLILTCLVFGGLCLSAVASGGSCSFSS